MVQHAPLRLRGAVVIDAMQPQFAGLLAATSDGFLPVPGETAYWIEIEPGIAINGLLDTALKSADVRPGALISERHFGTLEVHGPDQGQVREAGALALRKAGLDPANVEAPEVLTSEIIHHMDAHHAALVNRSRGGMLALAGDTLFTLEVTPAVWVLLAANEAEKAAPIRLVDLENQGAVGRLRLCGDEASVEVAVRAAELALTSVAPA